MPLDTPRDDLTVHLERAFLVSVATIPDGSSNTLLISEKQLNTAYYFPDVYACNDDQGWTDGWDNDNI